MSTSTGARVHRSTVDHAPAVMLTTASATDDLRNQAAHGNRPMSEFLVLERDYGVGVVDWTKLWPKPTKRNLRGTAVHVGAGWRMQGQVSAILSDGEHLGLPLAAALALESRRPRHIVIGHRMSTRVKRWLASRAMLRRGLDVVIVHCELQAEIMRSEIGLDPQQVRLVPYGVDTDFWSPEWGTAGPPERLIVAAGREHRDYGVLSAAVRDLDVEVHVADGSTHSPQSPAHRPAAWPSNVWRGSLAPTALRKLYGRAAAVVIPLVETDFQAGITVIAEAMAMGKPVVASATAGLRGAIGDPENLYWVPPGDPRALRETIQGILAHPLEAAEKGELARASAMRHHSLNDYAATLNSLLLEVRGS